MQENIVIGGGPLHAARQGLQHLLEVASSLVFANAAAIVLVRDNTSQVIQSIRPASLNATFRWPNGHQPYDTAKSHVITKIADLELSRAIRAMLGNYRTGFLVRVPIVLEPAYTIALLLHSSNAEEAPDRQAVTIVRTIARAMASEARLIANEALANQHAMAVPDSFEELLQSVLTDNGLRLLFDADAELLGASRGIKMAFELLWGELAEAHFLKSLPCADSLQHLFQRVQETEVSSPEIEINLGFADKRSVTARLNPVRPLDSDQTLVEFRMNPIGWNMGEVAYRQENSDANFVAGTAEAFLMDTLLAKRSGCTRKDTSYVTVRAWRSTLKKHQIAALRMIKSHDPQYLGEMGGNECAAELEHLVGLGTFRYIVPMPCGHSPPEKCLSYAIARAAGAKLNIPVVNAFAHMEQSGSSHPRTIATRPPMRVIQPVPGPSIIIDDVATSGAHLFEASSLLKQAGSNSFSLAWIGGEAP